MNEIFEKTQEVANVLKTLGHPKRLIILCLLKDGEKSVGELEKLCETGQSQISLFLKRMMYEGIIDKRRDGNFIYYSIKDDRVSKLIKQLDKIYCN